MAADKLEVPNDLCLKNIIATCLEYEYKEALSERANMFLDMIFNQPVSAHYTSLLMGLFDLIKVEEGESPILSYQKFFVSTFNDNQTRFSNDIVRTVWSHHYIPINGGEVNRIVLNTKQLQD